MPPESSPAPPEAKPSRLLSLPAELRNLIYEFVMTEEDMDCPPTLDLWKELDSQIWGVSSAQRLFKGYKVLFAPPDSPYRGLLRCNRQASAETRALMASKRSRGTADLHRTLFVQFLEEDKQIHLYWRGAPWLPCPYSKLDADVRVSTPVPESHLRPLIDRLMHAGDRDPPSSPAFWNFWIFVALFAAYCGPFRNRMAEWATDIRYAHPLALTIRVWSADKLGCFKTWNIYNDAALWNHQPHQQHDTALHRPECASSRTIIYRLLNPRARFSLGIQAQRWLPFSFMDMIEYSDYYGENRSTCYVDWR